MARTHQTNSGGKEAPLPMGKLLVMPHVRYSGPTSQGAPAGVSSILQKIASGDRAAVQTCIDQYGGLIWSIARRLLRNNHEAEDAVQQIFVELWRSAGRFDPELSSEKNFVAMVARRHLISKLRKVMRQPDQVDIDTAPEIPDGDPDRIERNAEASLAARFLKELKPDQRRMLELSIYYGMSHGEIAETTSTPIGTVKSHIRRGLNALRERMTSAERGDSQRVLT